MTLFITLFVGVQLSLGFLALISLIRNAPEGLEDERGFHLVREGQASRRMVLAPFCTPAFILNTAVAN